MLTLAARAARQRLYSALYAFAVFGAELIVLVLIDPVLRDLFGQAGAPIAHWLVTALLWTVGAWLVWWLAVREEPGLRRSLAEPVRGGAVTRAIAVVAAMAIAIGIRVWLQGEWKLAAELARLQQEAGALFPAAAVALLLYYVAEVIVIVTLVRFGQAAGELWGGHRWVPWGGLVLAVTWGAVHILLQGPDAGLYAMGAALLYGVVFSLGPRRLIWSSILIAVPFLL